MAVDTLTEALHDGGIVAAIADNMLPRYWSGSRVGHLEAALENIKSWDDPDATPRFRHAVEAAVATFKRWVEAEKERERREEEFDLWA